MENLYNDNTAIKLNFGKTSSVTLYGRVARKVEIVTLVTVVVFGIAFLVKAFQ